MDRALIRRKALLAAGSVVLAAGLTACPTPKADTADTSAETRVDDTSVADTGDGRPDCTGVDLSDTGAYNECCTSLQEWCEATYGVDTEDAAICTWGETNEGSTGCIPWGPPMPPRMRALV